MKLLFWVSEALSVMLKKMNPFIVVKCCVSAPLWWRDRVKMMDLWSLSLDFAWLSAAATEASVADCWRGSDKNNSSLCAAQPPSPIHGGNSTTHTYMQSIKGWHSAGKMKQDQAPTAQCLLLCVSVSVIMPAATRTDGWHTSSLDACDGVFWAQPALFLKTSSDQGGRLECFNPCELLNI